MLTNVDIVELARWAQVVGLAMGSLVVVVFLARYVRVLHWANPASRFIMALNVFLLSIALATIMGRLAPRMAVIELGKAVLIAGLVVVLATQLHLMRRHSEPVDFEKGS